MFHDLDTALSRLLGDPQAPPHLKTADIAFDTPEKAFQPAQDATVNLFLFEVSENRDLRDSLPLRDAPNGVATTKRPPLRVDCSYLVTAWSRATGAKKVQEEHRLLSETFVWLNRFPVIPDQYFDFTGSSLKNPLYTSPAMIARMGGDRSPGEFWQALGIAPRPAFYLTVTIAIDPVVVLETATQVASHQFAIKLADELNTTFAIGGTLRDVTSRAPIASATVTVRETGASAKSNADGQFRIKLLVQGQYTLDAAKQGYTSASKVVQVPGVSPTAFDLDLTPSP